MPQRLDDLPTVPLYRCCSCGLEDAGWPGPVICPACGSVRVRWVNYREGAKVRHPEPDFDVRG